MGQLANHLSPRSMLDQQRIFPADARSPGHVCHLDKQGILTTGSLQGRDAAIDQPIVTVRLGRLQSQFVRVRRTGRKNAVQNVLQLVVIADHLQQRLVPGPCLADAEQIFSRRIEGLDQQIAVENNDTGVEALEYWLDRGRRVAVVAPCPSLVGRWCCRFVYFIVFCCT